VTDDWNLGPRTFEIVYIPIGGERGFSVFHKEIYMSTIESSIVVSNGKTGADERGFSLTVRYPNMGPDVASGVAAYQAKIKDSCQKMKAGDGDLTVTLSATVDGVAQKPISFPGVSWKEVTKAEREVWKAGDHVLAGAEKKHGA